MSGFEALGVRGPILVALAAMGYEEPAPIQSAAIPALREGGDVLVEAQTGSGKTTAFGVRCVEVGAAGPGVRVLVLVPTRELARQVAEEVRALGAGSPFRGVAVTGGVLAEKEERTLAGDVRCVVATPGRLLALLEAGAVRLDRVALVVLDEADRMLDMGFRPDVEKLLDATKARAQTVLVSATLPRAVLDLAAGHLRPGHVHIRTEAPPIPESLQHFRLNVLDGQKDDALVALLKAENPERAIVFVRTRDRAATLARRLKTEGLAADPLQGEMSHDQRRHVFDLFQRGTTRILVATDLASRGLDVPEMELVVNADLPEERGAYVHRAGRAARMGRPGKVVSLVLPREKPRRVELEREVGGAFAPYPLRLEPPPKEPEPARPARPGKPPRKDAPPQKGPKPDPELPPSRRERRRG